jgi:colanic acid/amylovoran biosynthesis glycosyltransferase
MKKVFFVEGENPFANFITRRIDYLSERSDVKIIVLLEFDDPYLNKNPRVEYLLKLNFKRFFNKSLLRLLSDFPFSLLRSFRVFYFFPRPFIKIRQRIYMSLVNNEILKKEFDIIHLQYIGQFSLIEWIGKMTGKPIISSVRGAQVTFMIDSNPSYSDVIRYAFRESNLIHCVSNSLLQRCLEIGAPSDKLFVNYNGIDTDNFKPDGERLFDGAIHFITVGSLGWRKGVHFQFLVIKLLSKKMPDLKFLLNIVGSGSDLYQLRYLAKTMNVLHLVNFLGQKPESEIISLLKNSHLYLTTSVAEGLSNSVMEALSVGLPVVSFNCEGAKEMVTDGYNGFVVDFGDINKFVERIEDIIRDRKVLKRFSENATSGIKEKFNVQFQINEIMNVYNRI